MVENSGFFNAIESGGTYDRVYDASSFADLLSLIVTNGVFVNPANQLKVLAKSGLKLTVKAGHAFIDGYWYELKEDATITLASNASAYPIKSVVTCKLDLSNRKITISKRDAVTSTEPINNGLVHELILAVVNIGVGVSTITDANITDTRPDSEFCGYVKGAVEQIDTTDLFKQFETSFNQWFETIKGKLTDDVAGGLQQQIDDHTTDITSLQNETQRLNTELTEEITRTNGLDKSSYSYNRSENKIKDLLQINTNDKDDDLNRTRYFGSSKPSTEYTNCPYTSGAFYFYRTVRFNSDAEGLKKYVTVELHEQYPVSGRIWSNTWSSSTNAWSGWKKQTPELIYAPTFSYHSWIKNQSNTTVQKVGNLVVVSMCFELTTGLTGYVDTGFMNLSFKSPKYVNSVLVSQVTGKALECNIAAGGNVLQVNARGATFTSGDWVRGQIVIPVDL